MEVRVVFHPDFSWIQSLPDSERGFPFLWRPLSNIDEHARSFYQFVLSLDCFAHLETLELESEIGYLVQYLVLCVLFTWKSWVHSTVVEVQVYILVTRRMYFLLVLLYCVLEYAHTEFRYYSTDLLSIGTEYKCTRKAPVLFERSLITSFSDRRMIENWLMKVGFQLLSISIFSFHERVRNPAYPLTTPSRDPGQLEQLNCRF